jgi:hypothetical protein
VICEAVQAYLAMLDGAPNHPEPVVASDVIAAWEVTEDDIIADDELAESWFQTFDDATHVAYQDDPPAPRLGRVGAWLRRSLAA